MTTHDPSPSAPRPAPLRSVSPRAAPARGSGRSPQASVRFAAVGDLHCTQDARGQLRELFAQASEAGDALLLCGDLTDYGLPQEAQVLAEELSVVSVPIVAVLGNHDFESGQPDEVRRILTEAGVRVLDGEACEVHGVGIAGVKGFCGGYGRGALGPWGEQAIKQFVNEAIQEALKLESALAKLRTRERLAILHYSPIEATVRGEPVEIYPFLGTSRLEDPLIRYPVNAAFHGHAHRGTPEGVTVNGTPVFNVARPLLQRSYPDRPAFRLFEVPRDEAAPELPEMPVPERDESDERARAAEARATAEAGRRGRHPGG